LGPACLVLALASYLLIYRLPLPPPPPAAALADSTKVFDRDGRLLYDSAGAHEGHHTYLPLSEVPLSLRRAVVATEDAGFYRHPGIDPIAIGRAIVDNALHLETRSGASTITQQLARNVYMDERERASASPVRKLREMALALRLERQYSKDEILERYLNRVYFGNLAYGVEAAARTYFGKSARELDLAESALLAGMLQAPSSYDPFRHLDAAQSRQRTVLALMVDAGYITRSQSAAAAMEPLALTSTPFPIQAPHFVAWVLEQLPQLAGEQLLQRGGLRIYTTLDLSLQEAAQAALARQIEALKDKNVRNSAVVAIDPADGGVLSMVGSPDYFDAANAGAVNAALALRQPGSAIKPVVYASALEQGMTASTPLLDVPAAFKTKHGEVYSPLNYDLTFHGVVPLREALASSYNVPAVRVLQSTGIEPAVTLGRDLGLTSFRDPADYDLSLTLGGGEVRLLDLTAAYAGFAGGGRRVEPFAVRRIETAGGQKLYAAAPDRPAVRVVSPETAFLISDILSDNEARTPSFGSYSPLRLNRPAAVKTGTTSDFRDNWTVGYSPDLAVGVWTGNHDGSPMRNVSGVDGAAPVWRDVMLAGLQNRPSLAFERPAGIEQAQVCVPSGLLPTPECRRTRVEVFARGTTPVREDDYYRRLECAPACDNRVYAFVPLEALPWARDAGLDLPPIAPYSAGVHGAATSRVTETANAALRLVSPADGLVLSMSREVRLADQVLPVKLLASVPVAAVEVFVNGEPLARLANEPYQVAWQLQPGTYLFEARATTAAGREVRTSASLQVLAP
jgi:penicillin-binding protein 1C